MAIKIVKSYVVGWGQARAKYFVISTTQFPLFINGQILRDIGSTYDGERGQEDAE